MQDSLVAVILLLRLDTMTANWNVKRLLKTIVLFFSYICMGLYNEITGPSLQDLRVYHKLSNKEISTSLSIGCGGMFAGALIGGFIFDRFPSRRYLSLAIIMVGATISMGSFSFCKNAWQLTVVIMSLGLSQGLQSTGVGPVLVDLWSYKATGPLSLIHGGYFIGFALAPLIISAFLSVSTQSTVSVNASHDNIRMELENRRHAPVHLTYSFLVITCLCAICCFAFFVIGIFEIRSEKDKDVREMDDNALSLNGLKLNYHRRQSKTFVETWHVMAKTRHQGLHIIELLIVVFFMFFSSLGGDRSMCRFIFSVLTEGPLHMDRHEAYFFNMMVGVMYAVSRFCVVFLSVFVRNECLLIVQMVASFLFSIFMTVFSHNDFGFWIITAFFCFFKGPIHPTTIGVFNRYIPVSGFVQLIINAGSGIGAMALLYLCGYLADIYGYQSFMYIILGSSITTLLTGILLMFLGRRLNSSQELCLEMDE